MLQSRSVFVSACHPCRTINPPRRTPTGTRSPSNRRARWPPRPSARRVNSRSSPRNRSTPSSTRWPPRRRQQAEALARLAVEETGYGVVADKIQKNLFASERVYHFIRPMKTVGRRRRDRRPQGHRDRRAVRRRRGDRPVDQSDVHGDLQDPDRHQGALRRSCSARTRRRSRCITPRRPRSWTRRRAEAGAPDGAISWMTTVTLEGTQELMKQREVAVILATGGMGLVRAAYSAGKPAYGVGPGNAPGLHRAHRRRREGGPRHRHRQDVRQRRALLVGELGRRRRGRRRRGAARSSSARAATSCPRPRSTRWPRVLVTPQRLPNPALVGKSATVIAREGRHSRCRPGTRVLIAPLDGRRPRLPAVDREALPGALLLRRRGLAGGLRALQADPALRRHGPHDVHPLAERAGHPGVRPEEAGVPHRREHADDARVDRPDDRARSGDDARVRRLRRQHHVRQHLAAAPAEHQATGVRAARVTTRLASVWRLRLSRSAHLEVDTKVESAARPVDFVCESDVRMAMRDNSEDPAGRPRHLTPAARDLGEPARDRSSDPAPESTASNRSASIPRIVDGMRVRVDHPSGRVLLCLRFAALHEVPRAPTR